MKIIVKAGILEAGNIPERILMASSQIEIRANSDAEITCPDSMGAPQIEMAQYILNNIDGYTNLELFNNADGVFVIRVKPAPSSLTILTYYFDKSILNGVATVPTDLLRHCVEISETVAYVVIKFKDEAAATNFMLALSPKITYGLEIKLSQTDNTYRVSKVVEPERQPPPTTPDPRTLKKIYIDDNIVDDMHDLPAAALTYVVTITVDNVFVHEENVEAFIRLIENRYGECECVTGDNGIVLRLRNVVEAEEEEEVGIEASAFALPPITQISDIDDLFRFNVPTDVISGLKTRIRELERQLIERHREFQSKLTANVCRPDDLSTQIDKIRAMVGIESCNGYRDYFGVITKTIIVEEEDGGPKRGIGRILIQIPWTIFVDPTTDIKLFNLDRVVSDQQAPHVNGDGSACWGNAAAALVSAIANKNLEVFVGIILEFLRHPDQQDQMGEIVKFYPEAVDVPA